VNLNHPEKMALFPFENSPNIPKQGKSGTENPLSITHITELINQITHNPESRVELIQADVQNQSVSPCPNLMDVELFLEGALPHGSHLKAEHGSGT
jgi:hypothetical protein